MNSLKIGIIGLFILLPFLFISFVQVWQKEQENKSYRIVENAAERAMRDGVFALKTYSRFSYDAEHNKKIEIAEQETLESINRSFAYALNAKTEEAVAQLRQDVRLVGFIAHDALIVHDQKTGERLEIPFYRMEMDENQVKVVKQNGNQPSQPDNTRKVERLLEKILQPYADENPLILPEHRSTLFGNDYSEVGVFMVVKGDPLQIGEERNYFKIGKVSLSKRKGIE